MSGRSGTGQQAGFGMSQPGFNSGGQPFGGSRFSSYGMNQGFGQPWGGFQSPFQQSPWSGQPWSGFQSPWSGMQSSYSPQSQSLPSQIRYDMPTMPTMTSNGQPRQPSYYAPTGGVRPASFAPVDRNPATAQGNAFNPEPLELNQ